MEARLCQYGWDENRLYDSVQSVHRCFKAVRKKEIYGYCVVWVVGDQFDLLIADQHQGQGLGRYLLQHVLGRKEFSVITDSWLEVRSGNRIAQALYSRLGFSMLGKRSEYYSRRGETKDALIMRR